MALRVPPLQVESVKKLVELQDVEIAKFLDALTTTGPHYNIYDLSEAVSQRASLSRDLVLGVVQVLASLYLTKDAQQAATDTFVDREVSGALKRAGAFSKEQADAQWSKVRNFLMAALSLEDTVGTAAKAGHVLTQHERIFVSARILSDIRPIFHVDISDKPHSAVIVHMLRLIYRNSQGAQFENYFALDSNDIRSLRGIIDRALKKEETLKKLMSDAGVIVLPPKEIH
ncbi:MAG TPA: hypothetical protein VMV59_12015 [Candidatus Dormibacteraeota bacterium]|nr:hypothetical protein [Candidatus Dormibacteraeota bacterium]